MRVLVTGSAGKIGAEVVRDLAARGYFLRTFDRVAVPSGNGPFVPQASPPAAETAALRGVPQASPPAVLCSPAAETAALRGVPQASPPAVLCSPAAEPAALRGVPQASPPAAEHFPGDVREVNDVRRAIQGVDAVVHLAAIANDRRGAADDVLTTNVQGTWNVLLACHEAGVKRVVLMSSINSLGNFGGHRPSDRLPIDDTYPHHPMTPYQMSKHMAEDLCRMFSDAYGMVTLCLRAVFVAFPDSYPHWRATGSPWRRDWGRQDYWAYVDVRDVCEAVARSLEVDGVKHDAFILAAPDTTSKTPTSELVAEWYPETPWTVDRQEYLGASPHVSLLDCSHAEAALGWRPTRSWRTEE